MSFVPKLSLIAKALARRIRGLAARTYAHRGRGGRFKGTTAACSRSSAYRYPNNFAIYKPCDRKQSDAGDNVVEKDSQGLPWAKAEAT